jgi:hypothetical protein
VTIPCSSMIVENHIPSTRLARASVFGATSTVFAGPECLMQSLRPWNIAAVEPLEHFRDNPSTNPSPFDRGRLFRCRPRSIHPVSGAIPSEARSARQSSIGDWRRPRRQRATGGDGD